MSSSTPSKLPASAPTVLELGSRRELETSRTLDAPRLATGTNPPSSGLDAHLIAIGTPPPGSDLGGPVEPTTVFLGQGAYVRPSRAAAKPPRPRAPLAIALLLGLVALALAPLAPLAWMHAAEQLDLIARGAYRESGKRVLHAVQGIGIAMTMVAVAATAFGATVLIARALSS
ncbi:MAG: hypothetical protein AB7T06_40165 [Kofleriaceae bacterium]